MCVSALGVIKKGTDLSERETAVRLAEGQGKHSKEGDGLAHGDMYSRAKCQDVILSRRFLSGPW